MSVGTEGVSYTLAPKIKDIRDPTGIAKKEDVPGPGMYNTIDFSSKGKYPISTVKNSKAVAWNPPTSKRFPSEL